MQKNKKQQPTSSRKISAADFTWIMKVPKTILQKMRLLKMPSKTFLSP